MSKVDEYRRQLRELNDWKPYLLKESGLPGPRGNLELAQAFCLEAIAEADSGACRHSGRRRLLRTRQVFPGFCGVMGLGQAHRRW